MTNGKKVLVAAGFIGYSYLLCNSSFCMGRIRGWFDAAKVLVDCMKAYDEKEEAERSKYRYGRYGR